VQAALGLGQLTRLEAFQRRRHEIARIYDEGLRDLPGVRPLAEPPGTTRHGRALYVVRVDPRASALDRDSLAAALAERGIGTGVHFRPIHEQTFYREHPGLWRAADLQATGWNGVRVLSLPFFPALRDADARRVVAELRALVA
jgi:UDP-4-amino-4-deoxy-L-arabinose-oxoglutarate aminotransferase